MLTGEQRLHHLRDDHAKDQIILWEFIEVPGFQIRIYYKIEEDGPGLGFLFYVAEVTGHAVNANVWDKESYAVCLYHGIATFDGVRHMHVGDEQGDGIGYLNYPNMAAHIFIYETLRDLETRHCRDCNDLS